MRLALTVDKDLEIDVEVRVPWVRGEAGRYRHGISFSRIHDEDREKIYRYVDDRFPELLRQGWWK